MDSYRVFSSIESKLDQILQRLDSPTVSAQSEGAQTYLVGADRSGISAKLIPWKRNANVFFCNGRQISKSHVQVRRVERLVQRILSEGTKINLCNSFFLCIYVDLFGLVDNKILFGINQLNNI